MGQTVTVIGLGYVGLPLACLCARKGFPVFGVDNDPKKIEILNTGKSHIDDEFLNKEVPEIGDKITYSTDVKETVEKSDVVLVCVPTPVDEKHMPNLTPLKDACEQITPHIQDNTLVLIESTIYPSTTEDIVFPILKKSGKKFLLAHCPERMDPGNKKYTLANIPRVVGGIDEESKKQAAEFYRKIVDAEIMELDSLKAAEATKILENTFRDINIAFVNEMAMSFDKAGINILDVIKGSATKPFAFLPHYPGAGVGGHCIPVDPYYLIERAKQIGFSHRFLELAREINNNMPNYTVELLEQELKKLNQEIKGANIGILGLAYKAEVDDIRESPSLKIKSILEEKKANIHTFDPFILDQSTEKDVDEILQKSDCIVLATDHKQFKDLDLSKLKEHNIKVVIDGRNCLNPEKVKELGIAYHGIGVS